MVARLPMLAAVVGFQAVAAVFIAPFLSVFGGNSWLRALCGGLAILAPLGAAQHYFAVAYPHRVLRNTVWLDWHTYR